MKGPQLRKFLPVELEIITGQIADALIVREVANMLVVPGDVSSATCEALWAERERYREYMQTQLEGQKWLASATDQDIVSYLLGYLEGRGAFTSEDVKTFCERMLCKEWMDVSERGEPMVGGGTWAWLNEYAGLLKRVGVQIRYLT